MLKLLDLIRRRGSEAEMVQLPPLYKLGPASIPKPVATKPGGFFAARPRVITPDTTPISKKRGWEKSGKTYRGYYRTPHGAWRGEIVQSFYGDFEIFIFSPPIGKIDHHEKRPCFMHRGGDRWHINLYEQPRNGTVDDCIWYVEQILIESHRKPKALGIIPF